jgi:segregation and condensation protein B
MSDQISGKEITTETAEASVSPLSLAAQVESVLFVASEPVSLYRLAQVLGVGNTAVKTALDTLENDLQTRGLRLQWVDNGVQLTTAPENSGIVEQFLGLEIIPARLSPAALEVLAIIAYKQPITRPQIDEVRGVNSDGALRTLLNKGLLEEVGRLDGPGRPILYGTTPEFMQLFGLGSLAQLPPLQEKAS